jgi:hypothetical protein
MTTVELVSSIGYWSVVVVCVYALTRFIWRGPK